MTDLSRDTILEAEFNYIAQTAFQAHEDRARATTFYLAVVGSLIAAILSSEVNGLKGEYAYKAFAALFFLLGLGGVRTLMELVRLRQAWFDSVKAMNAIKTYYICTIGDEAFTNTFKWRMATCPQGFKPWSVSFLVTLQTALLASLTFGVGVGFLAVDIDGEFAGWWVVAAGGVGVVTLAGQIMVYWWQLRRCKPMPDLDTCTQVD